MEGILQFVKDYVQIVVLWFQRLRFTNTAQLAFLEDFYLLVNDGIPPNRAIDMMTEVSRGINRQVAIHIASKIGEGQAIAEGMREWFNINIVEIIRVGEEGGTLNETLKSAINTLTQRGGLLKIFFGAISYPTFVIIIACVMIVYLNESVFTQFRAMKPENEWPAAGRELVDAAHIIESWWWLVVLLVVGIIFIMRRLFSNYTGALRPYLDQAPPFSLYRRFVAARFLETLGLLVANGVVFKQALKVMQYRATPYLIRHLIMMEQLLSTGKGNVADILETGLVDEDDVVRLRVMAEVKGFEHGLIRMGIRGSERSADTMRIVSRTIGGLMMIVGMFMIIIIIRGIYLTGMAMGTGA